MARNPSVTDEGKRAAGVERVITHRHPLLLDLGSAEFLAPIVNTSDLDAPARLHFGRALWSCWQCAHQEALVVSDQPCQPIASPLEPQPVSLSGSLSERRMVRRVVDRVEVLAEGLIQLREMPDRLALGVDGLGHLPDITRDLGIAFEVVNELRVGRAEETLDQGSEPRLCRRASLFGAFVPCEQTFEKHAAEFSPTVNDYRLGQVRVSAHAVPQGHHTRAVTGGVEGHVRRKNTAAEGIRDQRQPRSSQNAAGLRTDNLHVELGVVNVCDFEGTIAVTRGLPLQFPVRRFVLVSRAPSQPLQGLPKLVATPHRRTKSRVTWCHDAAFVAASLQCCPGSQPGLLLQCLIIILDGLEQSCAGRRRKSTVAVSPLTTAWQESEISATKAGFRLSVA